jgi:carbonic anhydrase/acetyltransferase-like protein (isoleucine patch superfamily)
MKKLIFPLFIILVALFTLPAPVSAKVIMQEKGTVTIPASEIVDDDLFVGAENFELLGTVTGDVFVGAGSVRIGGNIKGGLFVGTGDLNLTGATIGNALVVGAGNVNIDKTSKIGGSLIVGAGTLRNYAPVSRNVMAGAGTIYLGNKVGKEARLGGGNIELGQDSSIAGNLTYALGEESTSITQDPEAVIGGTITRYIPPVDARRDMTRARQDFGKFGAVAHRGWLIISFLGSLLVGFILLKLFSKTMLGLATQVSTHLMPSMGIGFLIIVFALPVFLVLALSIIGLPLAGSLLLLLCLSLHLAKLVTSYALGRFIARQFSWNKMGSYAVAFIGLAVFYLLRATPGIGWVTTFLFTWAGLGAIWLHTRAHLKNL